VSDKFDEVDPSAVLGPADGVAWVAIGDEIVVYRAAQPASFVLNATAGLLWQCLDGASPLADIVDDIADTFEADRGALEADCLEMASTWLAHDLVEDFTHA